LLRKNLFEDRVKKMQNLIRRRRKINPIFFRYPILFRLEKENTVKVIEN